MWMFVFGLALGLALALIAYAIRWRYLRARASRNSAELYLERERAVVTLDSVADGVLTTDVHGTVQYLNPVAERLTGWSQLGLQGRRVDDVLVIIDESSGDRVTDFIALGLRADGAIAIGDDLCLLHRNGRRQPVNVSVAPMRDADGQVFGAVVVLQDVAKTREMSQRLSYQATHDDLTGLCGRREFEHRVNNAIESARTEQRSHVLCYLDLDQFKVVNDTCGHIAGDNLLREVATLLGPRVRETDTLARLGGDEFGILLQDCFLEEAVTLADQLIGAIKRYRFSWEEKTFEIAVSVGVVAIDQVSSSLTQILSFADSACYMAKEKGGNRVHAYSADDDAMLKRHGEMQWLHRITEAYSENRFVLFAQEIVPLQAAVGAERRYEVLLRMLGAPGELVLPMEYILAAERYNMITDLDRWVISNAFALISDYVRRRRQQQDLPLKRFAINLSGQSLGDERTLEYVQEQFAAYPDLPPSIIFEITETAAISNFTQARSFIARFREMGCSFSLDDFGSGVSSFGYLKNLPVDYIKIDGGFIKEMSYDPVNFALVGSINHIGHVMGLKTIAEYVDSKDVMDKLADIGVDYGQGNWLGEPKLLRDAVDESG